MRNWQKLQDEIGYKFTNISLLKTALTHTSYAKNNKQEDNQRLEFLGDAILSMAVAEFLYTNHKCSAGTMTDMRSNVVCSASLANTPTAKILAQYLQIGTNEANMQVQQQPNILEDAFEALIAAIFLDGGIVEVKNCIYRWLDKNLAELSSIKSNSYKDAKNYLQEIAQKHGLPLPTYETVIQKNNLGLFEVICTFKTKKIQATGKTKKEAQKQAAQEMLIFLQTGANSI